MLRFLAPLALLYVAVPTAPAQAESLPLAQVAYADLDLSKASDIKRLDARITRAIDKACSRMGLDDTTVLKTALRHCREQAHAQVLPQRTAAIAHAHPATRTAASGY